MAMADRDAATQAVIDRLKTLYRDHIMPVEQLYRYAFRDLVPLHPNLCHLFHRHANTALYIYQL